MTPDRPPDRFPPQLCGICGAVLVPVSQPEGDSFELLCPNLRCPMSRVPVPADDEEEETP